jgi:hypothetical protein
MIAATYSRKSTEQNGADADAKSVARQQENARAFAQAKGWIVAHEYADDAVSGADVKRLVDRQRLLGASTPSRRFRCWSCATRPASAGATATRRSAS